MSDDEGRLLAGRYRLQRRIGGGAMGVVWQAMDETLARTVAAKQLRVFPGLSAAEAQQAKQRAFREGRIAARLQHQHAIVVYDVADDDGQPVLVMEYLPSRSLAEVLDERGSLPPVEVAMIGAQAASALAAAHLAGIVHRDIKPANVLLGDEGTTKITDFGISRAVGDIAVTQTGLLAGTPAYLSPESARGEEPGAAADVFSLGATLYAAVEGQPPFGRGENEIALLHAVASGRVIPPRQAGPLTGWLNSMLHDDPAARPSMAQVSAGLRQVADGHGAATVAAAPPVAGAVPTRTDLRPVAAGEPADGGAVAGPRPSGARRGKRVALAGLAFVAAVGIGVLATTLLTGNGTSDANSAAPPASSAPPDAEPTGSAPTSGRPTSTTPTTTTTTTKANGPKQLQEAVSRYYDAMPGDTDLGWTLLGPGLQAQGKASYDKFWSSVKRVKVRSGPKATGPRTVEVRVELTMRDKGKFEEVHQLGLDTSGERPLIDSDKVVSSKKVKEGDSDDEDD